MVLKTFFCAPLEKKNSLPVSMFCLLIVSQEKPEKGLAGIGSPKGSAALEVG